MHIGYQGMVEKTAIIIYGCKVTENTKKINTSYQPKRLIQTVQTRIRLASSETVGSGPALFADKHFVNYIQP